MRNARSIVDSLIKKRKNHSLDENWYEDRIKAALKNIAAAQGNLRYVYDGLSQNKMLNKDRKALVTANVVNRVLKNVTKVQEDLRKLRKK